MIQLALFARLEAKPGKEADFKPYILKSVDMGKTWTSISSNLPENGPVLAFAEDTVNPHLLFAAVEQGLLATAVL